MALTFETYWQLRQNKSKAIIFFNFVADGKTKLFVLKLEAFLKTFYEQGH